MKLQTQTLIEDNENFVSLRRKTKVKMAEQCLLLLNFKDAGIW